MVDDESIREAVDLIIAEWGGVDVLVNNAVVWARTPPGDALAFEDLDPADWRRLVRGILRASS